MVIFPGVPGMCNSKSSSSCWHLFSAWRICTGRRMWDVHCFDYKRFILVLFCQVLVRYDTGCALKISMVYVIVLQIFLLELFWTCNSLTELAVLLMRIVEWTLVVHGLRMTSNYSNKCKTSINLWCDLCRGCVNVNTASSCCKFLSGCKEDYAFGTWQQLQFCICFSHSILLLWGTILILTWSGRGKDCLLKLGILWQGPWNCWSFCEVLIGTL